MVHYDCSFNASTATLTFHLANGTRKAILTRGERKVFYLRWVGDDYRTRQSLRTRDVHCAVATVVHAYTDSHPGSMAEVPFG